MMRIGPEFANRGIATFRATQRYVETSGRWGFDGQFYAEVGLDPLLRDPQLGTALDSPTYRSRRILMPWLAWLGGLGHPSWILNVYAALNLVFWVGSAAIVLYPTESTFSGNRVTPPRARQQNTASCAPNQRSPPSLCVLVKAGRAKNGPANIPGDGVSRATRH